MSKNCNYRRKYRGLTLIELMIALLIVGLLAGVAVPSYRAQIEKARISEAIGCIGEIDIVIQRFHTQNFRYPDSLAAITSNGDCQTDPWGNVYVYLNHSGLIGKGGLRKDRNLNPLNSDYDLYSKGADGDTETPLTAAVSQDDIIRANNGGYIGLGADY